MEAIKETWERIIVLIKEEMKDAPFNSFIKPLEPVSIEKEKKLVTLKAPNKMTKERIEGRWYNNQIRDSIRDILGPEYDFKLVLPEDIKPAKPVRKAAPAASKYTGNPINPRYTFNNFVQGKSNHCAAASALAVARGPFETFNPLFIYGGVGLGKTHLICAIANEIITRMPELDVMYITAETFVNDYISSIRDKTQTEFREKYRHGSILAKNRVDNGGKEKENRKERIWDFRYPKAGDC